MSVEQRFSCGHLGQIAFADDAPRAWAQGVLDRSAAMRCPRCAEPTPMRPFFPALPLGRVS